MDIKEINQYPRDTIDKLLDSISFYKTVKQQDPWQYEVLLQYSRMVYFEPGEVVLKTGEKDSWLYFLLKGQLTVHPGDRTDSAINYITPGEVFGDLAMLVDDARTANVLVDQNCKQAVAFGTDFTAFGKLEDFTKINLQTKLSYYRNTVHNLRWKLEVYRSKYPAHGLATEVRKVKPFMGARDGLAELRSLYQQGCDLAHLMLRWNREFGSPIADGTPSPDIVAAVQ